MAVLLAVGTVGYTVIGNLLDGRSLVEVGFRQRFQAAVVGVLRSATGEWHFNSDARLPLAAGDALIVLGSLEQPQRIRAEGALSIPATSIR